MLLKILLALVATTDAQNHIAPLLPKLPRKFFFGASISAGEAGVSAASRAWTTTKDEGNIITSENGCKFNFIQRSEGNFDFRECDAVLLMAKSLGIKMRGHTLNWFDTADWVKGKSAADTMKVMKDTITRTVTYYRNNPNNVLPDGSKVIYCWDVINEAIEPDVLGGPLPDGALSWDMPQIQSLLDRPNVWLINPNYFEEVIRAARAADPNVLLIYNGWNVPKYDGNNRLTDIHTRNLVMLLQVLQRRGVQIDGVGLQMHVSTTWYSTYSDMINFCRDMRAMGLVVHITELDIDSGSEATVMNIYQQLAAGCLDSVNCEMIVSWGWSDSHSPRNPTPTGPLIFDGNWNKKQRYNAFYDEILKRATGVTPPPATLPPTSPPPATSALYVYTSPSRSFTSVITSRNTLNWDCNAWGCHLTSENGLYQATLQHDCKFMVYKMPETNPVWDSQTWRGAGSNCFLAAQSNGQLVIYSGGNALWTSNAAINPPASSYTLTLRNDGVLVWSDVTNRVVWSTLAAPAVPIINTPRVFAPLLDLNEPNFNLKAFSDAAGTKSFLLGYITPSTYNSLSLKGLIYLKQIKSIAANAGILGLTFGGPSGTPSLIKT